MSLIYNKHISATISQSVKKSSRTNYVFFNTQFTCAPDYQTMKPTNGFCCLIKIKRYQNRCTPKTWDN